MATQASMGIGVEDLSSPEAIKAAAAELVGTAIFVLLGTGSVAAFVASTGQGTALTDGLPVIALTHAFAYAMIVAGLSGVSGGHINPAVTFAMLITGRVSVVRGLMYVLAQLLGACLAVLLLRAFIIDSVLQAVPGGGGEALSPAVDQAWHGMLLTALGSFVLVWTIFAVTLNPRTSGGVAAPLYIGLAVGAIYFFLVPFTGGGIDPARSLGPALFLPAAADGVAGRFDDQWIYWIGPLLGSSAAALSYYLLYLMPSRSAA